MKRVILFTTLFAAGAASAQTTGTVTPSTSAPVGQTAATSVTPAKANPYSGTFYSYLNRAVDQEKVNKGDEVYTENYLALSYKINDKFKFSLRQNFFYSSPSEASGTKAQGIVRGDQTLVLNHIFDSGFLNTDSALNQYRYHIPTSNASKIRNDLGYFELTNALTWNLNPKISLEHAVRLRAQLDSSAERQRFNIRFHQLTLGYAFNDQLKVYGTGGYTLNNLNKRFIDGKKTGLVESKEEDYSNSDITYIETGVEVVMGDFTVTPSVFQGHKANDTAAVAFNTEELFYQLEAVVAF